MREVIDTVREEFRKGRAIVEYVTPRSHPSNHQPTWEIELVQIQGLGRKQKEDSQRRTSQDQRKSQRPTLLCWEIYVSKIRMSRPSPLSPPSSQQPSSHRVPRQQRRCGSRQHGRTRGKHVTEKYYGFF